ncbi:hypothetical protein BY996DRAFT_6409263 [Phakopsora pachyrhizi]|nr:hypothetical protein BY996DRAFT_6409260 [Phakopsora pachyrhizi]KAI8460606.1 hypothetical protein BY996DRAFT_6409263 [Phakopsora pachyrhizi]
MDPKHFRQITQGGTIDNIMWKCYLCNTRATTNIVKHSNTKHHKAAMETDDTDGEHQISAEFNYLSNTNESESESYADSDADSIKSSELSSDFYDTLSKISEEMESSSEAILEKDIDREMLGEAEEWYPFTSKEFRQLKQNFKDQISLSVLGNPICNVGIEGLLTQELGNALVSSFLEFYPEQSDGKHIYKLSQSKKWLHEYPRDLRGQMISVGGKHYYIYEPVQLNDGSVVVPMFFYIRGDKMYAKTCKLNVRVISFAEVNISISWNRNFYSADIKEVLREEFLKPYTEILKLLPKEKK